MSESSQPSPLRRWLLLGVKGLIAGVLLFAVWGTLSDAAAGLRESPLRPHWPTAALGAAVYLLAYAPMALFWRMVLAEWSQPTSLSLILKSYYVGHLGKYVPGKAMVVVLRTGMLRAAGGRTAPIATSVLVETLTLMSVGGVISGALLATPLVGVESQAWLMVLAFALAVAAATPTLPPVMNRLIELVERRRGQADPAHRFPWRLFATGWIAAAISWCGLALSLWLGVRSLSPGFALTPVHFLVCLLGVALPVVAGFLSMIPGGFGVRDFLMVALLTPTAGEEVALAATVLVRLTWVAAEAVVCGMLMLIARGAK